jgi:hypothetical protein
MAEPQTYSHYYDDRGGLNHDFKDRKLLVALAETIGIERLYDLSQRPKMLAEVYEAACGLITSYGCSKSMAGLGGCKTVDEFFVTPSADPLENALKPLLKEMLEQGIYEGYFRLVAVEAYHDLLFNTYEWKD